MISTAINPRSITLVLAYFQHYNCKFIRSRCLHAEHLRRLTAWQGYPDPRLRTARQHPLLADHLVAVVAAGLADVAAGIWLCTTRVPAWLQLPRQQQEQRLAELRRDNERLHAAAATLGWSNWQIARQSVLSFDHSATAGSAAHERHNGQAAWLSEEASHEAAWRLRVPDDLAPALLFELLQLGEWQPAGELRITPAAVMTCGYGPQRVEEVLCRSTGAGLAGWRCAQLLAWYLNRERVRLRHLAVLETRQPKELQAIMADGWLRRFVIEQISPRHAFVKQGIARPLAKRLGQHGIVMQEDGAGSGAPRALAADDAAWIGLKVLAELGRIVPLPLPAVRSERYAGLIGEKEAELGAVVDTIVAAILQAIRGHDAFFPALEGPVPELMAAFETAVVEGHQLDITYQGVADRLPRLRQVLPLRVWTRGNLVYVDVYCLLSEANRTLRLDRVTSWQAGT